MKSKGQSLELFFIDGKPDGMLTAEVFNWTGHVLMTPRTKVKDALKRKESKYTGVYILLGENADGPLAYIGEGDDVSYRIKSHDTAKDWWTTAILITSAANNLHKAHVKYLESRLIREAKDVGKIVLENANTPSVPALSESAQSNMEAFLDNILMVLPALRVDCFVRSIRHQGDVPGVESSMMSDDLPVFELITKKTGVHGVAMLVDGDFIVKSGSVGCQRWGGVKHHYAALFDQVVASGVYVEDGRHRIFTNDYVFNSPSAAGAVLNGRATAGPVAWKLKGSNKTYKDWELEMLANE